MRRLNKVFKNISIGILHNAFNIVVSVFVNGYIAGQLGTGDYGKFIFAFAFPQVFSVIADFGLQGYYTKKIAAHREATRQYLGEMMAIRMATSVVAVFLAVIAFHFTGHAYDDQAVILIGIASVLVAQTLFTNAWTVFQAHEDMKYVAVSNVLSRILVAVLSVVTILMGGGLLAITCVYALGYFVQVAYCFLMLVREGWTPIFSMRRSDCYMILKNALPFSLFSIFSYLALQIDKTMLDIVSGHDALGIYNAASSLAMNSNMISIAVANAVFPTLVQSFRQNRMDEFSRKMQIILKWMLLLGMPLAFVILFYAKEIILFIYRNVSYEPSVLVLQVLIWMLPIDLMARVMRYALIAGDKEHSVTWFYGAGLVINLGLNLVLMPKYSYMGAAYSAIATQIFLLVVQSLQYFRALQVGFSVPIVRIAIGNIALLAMLWLWSAKVYWMAGMIIGIVFFGAMMVLLGVINKEDFSAIRKRKEVAA